MTHIDRAFIKAYGKASTDAQRGPSVKSESVAERAGIAVAAPRKPVSVAISTSAKPAASEPEAVSAPVAAPVSPSPQPPRQPILSTFQPLANMPHGNDSKSSLAPKTRLEHFQWGETDQALALAAGPELSRLAEQLADRAATEGLKLMLVTSWSRGEGRTSLLLCLGRSLAERGLKVALVDCDFAQPSLAGRLGLKPAHGWTDVLTGEVSLADTAIESEADRLVVLPLGETTPAAHSTAPRGPSGPRLRLVLGLLRRDYDLVLIDGGPLSEGNDPPVGWPQIDAAIVVHNPQAAPSKDLLQAEQHLNAAGIVVLGIAENSH